MSFGSSDMFHNRPERSFASSCHGEFFWTALTFFDQAFKKISFLYLPFRTTGHELDFNWIGETTALSNFEIRGIPMGLRWIFFRIDVKSNFLFRLDFLGIIIRELFMQLFCWIYTGVFKTWVCHDPLGLVFLFIRETF